MNENPLIEEELPKEKRSKKPKNSNHRALKIISVIIAVIVLIGAAFAIGFMIPKKDNSGANFTKSAQTSKHKAKKVAKKKIIPTSKTSMSSSKVNQQALLRKTWAGVYNAGNTTWYTKTTLNSDGTFTIENWAGADDKSKPAPVETKGTFEVATQPYPNVTYNYQIPNSGTDPDGTTSHSNDVKGVKPVTYLKFTPTEVIGNTQENAKAPFYMFGIDGNYAYSYSYIVYGKSSTQGKAIVDNTGAMVYIPAKNTSSAAEDNAQTGTYTVADGDTLKSIAQKFGITLEQLDSWNGIGSDGLYTATGKAVNPGDILIISDKNSTSTTTSNSSQTSTTSANLSQIQNGDFSSIQGTWKSDGDYNYGEIVITKNSISFPSLGITITKASFKTAQTSGTVTFRKDSDMQNGVAIQATNGKEIGEKRQNL